jgi:hypothetical protein
MEMDTLTIKLLHERRSNNRQRKINGKSGEIYPFHWSADYNAYVFTTGKQDDLDDIFESQGRAMGSYFAPVITLAPKVAPLAPPVTAAASIRIEELPHMPPAQPDTPKGKCPPKAPPTPATKPARAA